MVKRRRSAEAADLQLLSDPPIEDGQVGVGGKDRGAQVHLLVPPDHRDHLQVHLLERLWQTEHTAFSWEKP